MVRKWVINYASSDKEASETLETITENGGDAIAIKADVSKPEDVQELFDKTIAHYGKVDVLINCAGIMKNKPFQDIEQDDFTSQFDVNVRGVFNTMQRAYHDLSDNGTILNFSSSTTKMMLPSYAIYSATKAAVEQMTRVVSQEIGPGISVNCIASWPYRNRFISRRQISRIY